MKIKQLNLFTNNLEGEKQFYTDKLGFALSEESDTHFTVQAGESQLTFTQSARKHIYHYCFLVPSNQIIQALAWAKSRIEVIEIEPNRFIEDYADWGQSKSFYFYDASGNIAEIIARGDLNNPSDTSSPFSADNILNINEIGIGSEDLEYTNQILEDTIQSPFFQGNLERFGTNGDWHGLFILVNYQRKKHWYPTETPVRAEPFTALIEQNEQVYTLTSRQSNQQDVIMTVQSHHS